MDILFAFIQEIEPNFIIAKVLESWDVLVDLSHVIHDVHDILWSRIQIWNLTIVQHVVDVLKEGLEDDLGIVQ